MSITILADTKPLTRPQAVALARRLWDNGDGGWTVRDIREHLARRGHDVTGTAVRVWVDPEYGERRAASLRASNRRWYHQNKRRQMARHGLTPELLLALRVEDGLTYSTIAKVARRFYGVELTESQVRYRLYALGAPKNPNKSRASAEQARRARRRAAA